MVFDLRDQTRPNGRIVPDSGRLNNPRAAIVPARLAVSEQSARRDCSGQIGGA